MGLPNGSIIVQDYRELLFTQVRTHAAAGGNYKKLMSDENGKSYVQTGYGDVNPFKHASAIAANFTHTLDARMIQDGVNSLEEGVDVVTVHDCVLPTWLCRSGSAQVPRIVPQRGDNTGSGEPARRERPRGAGRNAPKDRRGPERLQAITLHVQLINDLRIRI